MICSNTIHTLNFVLCLAGAKILWLIPDKDLARSVIEAMPAASDNEPSPSIGRAAKLFLTAALVYCFVQASPPTCGQLLETAWSICEHSACWCGSLVLQTLWRNPLTVL
ncbi:MAG: hypothetical protein K2X81_00220 [Candidatus Obscuribacterales bacterium]|nr:hypothetical protein [Candidatus Obscuribacterales bacterium]